ncbi:hypothetical protein [Kitasatospora cathayae]|uniref:Uncharacterized protein n=1 Tax=Kitasatospora cathayae TaxID=3004092 RepID=A0ABY7Q824_9ACTN|nr:hypothetical protein [Kitasatospora sp. HUAS 3-15]WBP88782.1 hypothetical protein O1G21_25080 [Kitasatospora sp. HUAS 3-15]
MTSDRSPSPAGADLPGPRSSATPYRMTVTTALPHAEAVALADEQLASWLKQEGCDEPPPTPDTRSGASPAVERLCLGERVLLDRDHGPLRGGPGAGRYDRRRLRTPAPHGTRQLTLTVATGAGGPTWFRLEAETHHTGSGVRTPCRVPVPELARTLLPLLDAADGPAAVHPAPRVITADEVDGLIDELCDPERRLPTVVASVPVNLPLDDWVEQVVRPLCRQLPGLATAYVLDPGARTGFNVALEYHTVYGGAVRTYLPEVDPASRQDGARHPVLARGRIEQDLRRAAGLLAREPRRLAADQPLPPPLAAVPVLRVPPPRLRPTAGRTSPAGAGLGDMQADPAAELAALAREEQQDRAEQQARADELERVRRTLRLERRDRGQGRDGHEGRLRTATRGALSGRHCGGPAAAPLPGAGPAAVARRAAAQPSGCPGKPSTFTELLARLAEFPLLTFTGDQKSALALDGLQCAGAGWARLAWDGLTALQEYAEAAVRGAAGGDFKQWCEHTPDGCHRFPPRKAVRGESRTVFSHTKWKRERMLPVPECVDASRRAFMGAHLRIGGGRTAPRLHYLDDCSGSGRIYVGYIGLHLTNSRTN